MTEKPMFLALRKNKKATGRIEKTEYARRKKLRVIRFCDSPTFSWAVASIL